MASHMSLTFNEIYTIFNTEGGVTSATPTPEGLRKKERRCLEFTMKIFESSDRAKIIHIFPAPISDGFSSEVPIFHVFYIYSIESFMILTASRKPAILPAFWRKNHQILEIAK
jgi:hypothetical protein